MTNKNWLLLTAISLLSFLPLNAQAAAPSIEPPSAEKIAEARGIIAKMRVNARGPYSNLQWVCKDGTVLPPKAGACTPHGGGNQYAKFSKDRDRLAKLGFPVGTIYIALDRGTQPADARPFQRLRDLPFEQYLVDIDDGWVLHKALGYRGSWLKSYRMRVQAKIQPVKFAVSLKCLLKKTDGLNRYVQKFMANQLHQQLRV